jgi:hypothetical protein
MEEEK